MRYDAGVVEPLHADLFGPLHAGYFDLFHRRKDYRAEVDQILATFADLGPVSSVLDLGCGTARHLELLAEAGLEVVGVDRSAAMVRLAGERLARFDSRASVVEGDLFEVRFERDFDAVTMMFSLIGYFVGNERVIEALRAAGRRLTPGGLLIFDAEDAAAVLRAETPFSGGSVVPGGSLPLLLGHHTRVDPAEQVIESRMHMWQFDGETVVDRKSETHIIRYFCRRELALLLEVAGFELVGYAPLAEPTGGAGRSWLRLVTARKV